jgi:hypothetical protein
VVVRDRPSSHPLMESQLLRERQGLHVTGSPLTRGMPALDRSPLARWLVPGRVGRLGEDESISRPEVAVASTAPGMASQSFQPVASDAGYDLPGAPTFRPSGPSAPQTPRTSPSSAGRRVSSTGRGSFRTVQMETLQPRPSPQADLLLMGPPSLLLRLRIPPWAPIRPALRYFGFPY